MKRLLIAVVFIFGLSALACQLRSDIFSPSGIPSALPPVEASETPLVVTPSVTEPPLPSIETAQIIKFEMFDASSGFAISNSELMRTRDGGITWQDISILGVESWSYYGNSFFLDAQHAWVAQADSGYDFEAGTLYRTTDGGVTWQNFPLAAGMGGSLFFLDEQNGWYIQGLGAGAGSSWLNILRTSDGGESWARVFEMVPGAASDVDAIPAGGQKSGLSFADLQNGWVGGNIPMSDYIYLYNSLDGGETWQEVAPPLPLGFGEIMTETQPPIFFDENQAVLPTRILVFGPESLNKIIFYGTVDGGQNWTLTTPVDDYSAYSFLTAHQGWAATGHDLMSTADGGMTWLPVVTDLPAGFRITSLDFVNPDQAWALVEDAGGTLGFYATQNGGQNWTFLAP